MHWKLSEKDRERERESKGEKEEEKEDGRERRRKRREREEREICRNPFFPVTLVSACYVAEGSHAVRTLFASSISDL